MFETKFKNEKYIIMDSNGWFIYGECEGEGKDFSLAQKFVDSEDAFGFLNHNRQYEPTVWKVFKVNINYEIMM